MAPMASMVSFLLAFLSMQVSLAFQGKMHHSFADFTAPVSERGIFEEEFLDLNCWKEVFCLGGDEDFLYLLSLHLPTRKILFTLIMKGTSHLAASFFSLNVLSSSPCWQTQPLAREKLLFLQILWNSSPPLGIPNIPDTSGSTARCWSSYRAISQDFVVGMNL